MAGTQSSRDVNAKQAVKLLRGPMTNAEIMDKLKITTNGFADLLRQLYQHKLLTEEDLQKRGIRFKAKKKDSEVSVPPVAPPPDDHDEEFLDTVTLTEMLSFSGVSEAPRGGESAEIEPPDPDS